MFVVPPLESVRLLDFALQRSPFLGRGSRSGEGDGVGRGVANQRNSNASPFPKPEASAATLRRGEVLDRPIWIRTPLLRFRRLKAELRKKGYHEHVAKTNHRVHSGWVSIAKSMGQSLISRNENDGRKKRTGH